MTPFCSTDFPEMTTEQAQRLRNEVAWFGDASVASVGSAASPAAIAARHTRAMRASGMAQDFAEGVIRIRFNIAQAYYQHTRGAPHAWRVLTYAMHLVQNFGATWHDDDVSGT